MINNLAKKTQKGFTIIEVMIVLAIAGLIMVVVLIAIPQLQASQRDSARRDVANRFVAEVGNYSTNNNGRLPITSAGLIEANFTTSYLGEVELTNPSSGAPYVAANATDVATDPTENQLLVYPGASCDGESATGSLSNTSRVFAVRVLMDGGARFYCADNN